MREREESVMTPRPCLTIWVGGDGISYERSGFLSLGEMQPQNAALSLPLVSFLPTPQHTE